MGVVSDTSPLNYLVLIEEADVLPRLFGNVAIPPGVRDELTDTDAPDKVRRWMARPPSWLQIRAVQGHADPELATLHRGEREALLLAAQIRADAVLLDERIARQVARQRGIPVIGTLGVLNGTAERNLLDVARTVERLKETSFRAAPGLYDWLLGEERKRSGWARRPEGPTLRLPERPEDRPDPRRLERHNDEVFRAV